MLLLAAIGLLYGLTGSLNMADLHQRVQAHEQPALLSAIAIAFLVALGVKAAIFPLFFWVPAAYPAAPVAVAAVFAGLVIKIGIYALLRVFTLIFTHDVGYTHTVMLVVAALSMVTGGLGAIAQHELRPPPRVPQHQPGRLHGARPGAVHAAGAGGRDLLHGPPQRVQGQPVPAQRHRRPARRLLRARPARRAVPRPPAARLHIPPERSVACRAAAVLRLLGQAAAGPGDRRRRTGAGDRRGARHRAHHPALDEQDLAHRVLGPAAGQGPRAHFAERPVCHAHDPGRSAGGSDPRRRPLARAAARPDFACGGRLLDPTAYVHAVLGATP